MPRPHWLCACPSEKPILQNDECVAQQPRRTATPGESCDENTVCTQESSCQSGQCRCQYGFIAVSGHCVALPVPTTPIMKNVVLARPLDSCPLDTCVGGAMCVDGLCVCPSGMHPSPQGRCSVHAAEFTHHHTHQPFQPRSSSQPVPTHATTPLLTFANTASETDECAAIGLYCRSNTLCACPSEKPILQNDECVAQQPRRTATPGESCDENTVCTQESSCDEDTGVCMCPPGHIVFGVQCQLPPSSLADYILATNECKDDTNCEEHKVCVVGRCKCKPGFVDHDGVCKPLEEIELGERPVPVSYAKHKVEILSPERIAEHDEFTDGSSSQMATTRTPSRQETQRPRIVGPPIRRPRPKPKATSSGSGGPGNYKSGSSGSGNCPPGNEATRDDSGRLIMCNGFEPNCPPRSYCYITTGGFASEEYNCCKSW
ncbi:EB module [Ostertagia ostertagi]